MAGIVSKVTGLATDANVLSGALGYEKEVEAGRTFLSKAEWEAAWALYQAKQAFSKKQYNVPSELDVPGLCKDIQTLKASELYGTMKKRAKQVVGRVGKTLIAQIASANGKSVPKPPKNAVIANAKTQRFRLHGKFVPASSAIGKPVYVHDPEKGYKEVMVPIPEDEVVSILQEASKLKPLNIQILVNHAKALASERKERAPTNANMVSQRIEALKDADQITRVSNQLQQLHETKTKPGMLTRSMTRFANAFKAPKTRKARKTRKSRN